MDSAFKPGGVSKNLLTKIQSGDEGLGSSDFFYKDRHSRIVWRQAFWQVFSLFLALQKFPSLCFYFLTANDGNFCNELITERDPIYS